ncbi:hypothetical protein H0H92_007286 [Tricholoma furcatifolium]|nr:hypothetical protein H0H92_007286 [Tricholoma furcatifolium]
METPVALRWARGIFGAVGTLVDAFAQQGLENLATYGISLPHRGPYHITLFNKDELKKVPSDALQKLEVDSQHLHYAGIGGKRDAEVFYAVIIWAAGQQVRKQYGFPPKNFHITLSTNDDHAMDKGIDSLLPNAFPISPAPDLLDHLAYTLHTFGRYSRAHEFSKDLILMRPNSHKGYLRLGDAAILMSSEKLAMLAYACAYERSEDDKIQRYYFKKLVECSKLTEWGSAMLDAETSQIDPQLATLLLTPWSNVLRTKLSESNLTPTLQLEPRESLYVPSIIPKSPYFKLPRFFRWLIPYHLAIMSTPRREEDIDVLSSPHLGIRHILTLTEETPLPESWFHGKPITNTYLPVPNFNPPSIEQMDLVMSLFSDTSKLPLLVHCGGGKGRAGTVAACYMAAFGFETPHSDQTQPAMAASDAVSLLRHIRPGSIETSQQEAFVSTWCSTIWKRQSVYPDLPSEPPPCPLIIEGSLDKEINLFVLVGLPGSGKSTVRKALLARDPSGWTTISQDESGSRASCETEIGMSPGARRVILDRCNTAATDRKGWLSLASNWSKAAACIFFDYDESLCIARAQMRAGHPTLPPGSRVRNAVSHMQNLLVRPTLGEGFQAIVTIRSFAAAQELILRLSPPITIYKFPRTAHLINLGAASSDDVISNVAVMPSQGTVVITEKIDGANMGFSLSFDRSRIIVQNRSHYVNSASHEQFKKLDSWVEHHHDDLFHVLDRDPHFPERYILFGEWMFATHSIPYTHLPDRFIAFDLYDRSTDTWLSRESLARLLSVTNISLVPSLHEGSMPTDAELRNMVQLPSKFWDGRIEGIYVKIEKDNCVKARGKVVRSDFIAGNEHWTKGNLRVNGLGMGID